MKQKITSCIIGAAIGDAIGVPFEFKSRECMADEPATDMVGYGTHKQPIGTWSDDTSMILATMDAMLTGFNYNKIMQNFCLWLYDSKFTPHDSVFDVGRTTECAIDKFDPIKENSLECGDNKERANGNGSLMRIAPFAFYCYLKNGECTLDENTSVVVHNGSSLTHAHRRSLMACGIYSSIIFELLKKQNKDSIYIGIKNAHKFYIKKTEFLEELKNYDRLFKADFRDLKCSEINSSGYVVDSLEAAVWCVLTTNTFEECVLSAVNLGGDTDTIASIAGGLAGILYGLEGIPDEWKEKLLKKEYIETLCNSFVELV